MESKTWCPRLTAAMILSGSAVQVKGFEAPNPYQFVPKTPYVVTSPGRG